MLNRSAGEKDLGGNMTLERVRKGVRRLGPLLAEDLEGIRQNFFLGTLPNDTPGAGDEEARRLVVNMPPRVTRRSLRQRLYNVTDQDRNLVTIHFGTKKYSGTIREVRNQLFQEHEADEDVVRDVFIDVS